MKSLIVGLMLGFALVAPEVVLAATKGSSQASQSRAVNRTSATDCNLCFTCGGDWPIFAGSFASPGVNNVTERGSSCGGGQLSRTDGRPFLCCKD